MTLVGHWFQKYNDTEQFREIGGLIVKLKVIRILIIVIIMNTIITGCSEISKEQKMGDPILSSLVMTDQEIAEFNKIKVSKAEIDRKSVV